MSHPPLDQVYSHRDHEWLERLQTMLKPLVRKKLVVWDDTKIGAGAKWTDEIQDALAAGFIESKVNTKRLSPFTNARQRSAKRPLDRITLFWPGASTA